MEGLGDAARVNVRAEPARREAVISLSGELDLSNVDLLEACVAPLIADQAMAALVFDLKALSFMDSSAIAVLLKAACSGKTVRLRNPSPLIAEVLSNMGLDEVLQVEK